MSQPAPGKYYRDGLSLIDLFAMFPDNATAERWFVAQRWPDEVACPRCGSTNVLKAAKHKTMPYRCREKACRAKNSGRFSARTGTALEGSNIGFQKWMIAIYLLATNLKGVSSMKLHRDLKISQRSAWFLAHRLRTAWARPGGIFAGPVEVDETFIGGKARSMHRDKRDEIGPDGMGNKVKVAGVRDRETGKVRAEVLPDAEPETLRALVTDTAPAAKVYSDGEPAYDRLPNEHESVSHSVGEYVRGQAHVNGMESFWAMLKRGFVGTYHRMSPEHLHRYVAEFEGRHNDRPRHTIDQMVVIVLGLEGKRLKYDDLKTHAHGRGAVAVQ